MSDGPLWLLASTGWLIVILAVAFRSGAVDRIADWLVGRRPAPPRWPGERGGKGHLRIVRNEFPRPLPPYNWEGDCGVKDWRGGDGAA